MKSKILILFVIFLLPVVIYSPVLGTDPVVIYPTLLFDTATPEPAVTEEPTAVPTQIPPTAAPTATSEPTKVPTAAAVPTQIPPTAVPTATAIPTEIPETAEPTAEPEPLVLSSAQIAETVEHISEHGPFDPYEYGIDPMDLLDTADQEIFGRYYFEQNYSETQGFVNEILTDGIIHQYYVKDGKASDILMSMFPAVRGERTSNLRLNLKAARAAEFHANFTLQRVENLPAGAGGRCWIRTSNKATKMKGSESGVILFPGEKAYYFEPGPDGTRFTAIADLTVLNQNREITFEFIRLNGVLYAYANGEFLFAYRDGINGLVSIEAGSELYEGGNRIHCEFDNFRELIPQGGVMSK